MTRIVLDPGTSARLKQEAADQIELCDDSGHTLGFFKPLADRSLYEGLEIPFTEEELALAEQETKTYSTAEVLRTSQKPGAELMFSVRWTSSARDGLATAWIEAKDRNAVTEAVVQIDTILAKDPENAGESRDLGRRLLLQIPIGVFFKVDLSAHVVQVAKAWGVRGSKGGS